MMAPTRAPSYSTGEVMNSGPSDGATRTGGPEPDPARAPRRSAARMAGGNAPASRTRRRVAASFAAMTCPRASTATSASPESCAARNAYFTTSSRMLAAARSRSWTARAIAFATRIAWRRWTCHGPVMSTRPAGAS